MEEQGTKESGLEELREHCERAEAACESQHEETERQKLQLELEHYKALEWERQKWEEKEKYFRQQIEEVKRGGRATTLSREKLLRTHTSVTVGDTDGNNASGKFTLHIHYREPLC